MVKSLCPTPIEQGYRWCFSWIGLIVGCTETHTRFKHCRRPSCLNTWTVYWAPALYLSVSEWFLLFTKNHWTAWRKCVQPERLGWAGRVGNASIHLFIFHRKQFWRQSCKKMASPQLGNRDSQNKFARKLSKVCHSRRSCNMIFTQMLL